jgi:spectinomycin phosphotransferase/16S rRNA (guanine(1405)-N(7))-methyltransferase
MLAPPDGLTEEALVAALARGWGIEVAGLEYRAVGFGSHHWEVVEAGGARWFITVDEPAARRVDPRESPAHAQARLAAAVGSARALLNAGGARFEFVVAPVPSLDGQLLLEVGAGFCASVYPMVEGESFSWGDYRDPDQRDAVLRMLIAVHTAPGGLTYGAPEDDFRIPMRDELELALAEGIGVVEHGPYSLPLARLLSAHEPALRVALREYDELARAASATTTHRVLTHGEPHAGNTMLTIDGWKLIDWDTAAVAPPERDLWDIDPGDGSLLALYEKGTGYRPQADLLKLYALRWDLTDLALFASDFRREHGADANRAKGWESMQRLVHGLTTRP